LIFAAHADSHGKWADATSALLCYAGATYVSQADARATPISLLTSVAHADTRAAANFLIKTFVVLTLPPSKTNVPVLVGYVDYDRSFGNVDLSTRLDRHSY